MLVNPLGAAGWGLASRASAVPQSVLQGSSLLSPAWGDTREPGQGLAPHLFLLSFTSSFFLSFSPHLMERSGLPEQQAPVLRDSSPLLCMTFCNNSPHVLPAHAFRVTSLAPVLSHCPFVAVPPPSGSPQLVLHELTVIFTGS